MDKESAIACLTDFMHSEEVRTLNYERHGKLIVQFHSNGCASVEVHLTPDLGLTETPWTGTFNTAEKLYEGIKSGLEKLCQPDDVADDLEAFLGHICPNA